MVHLSLLSSLTVALAASSTLASSEPPSKRGSRRAASIKASPECTFTDAASAEAGKGSCSTIRLSNVNVAAGETLDLSNLKQGTKVIFQGTTTFGYKEWVGDREAASVRMCPRPLIAESQDVGAIALWKAESRRGLDMTGVGSQRFVLMDGAQSKMTGHERDCDGRGGVAS